WAFASMRAKLARTHTPGPERSPAERGRQGPSGPRQSGKRGPMQRTVEIADDSFEAMQRLAFELGWGDGLPLVAPTESRVDAMLAGRDPGHVIGVMPPRHAEVTNLAVAANAVMAGGPPTVFRVVTTPIRAMRLGRFYLAGA